MSNDYIVFVSMALFAVWEKRHNGWFYFWGALQGKWVLPARPA